MKNIYKKADIDCVAIYKGEELLEQIYGTKSALQELEGELSSGVYDLQDNEVAILVYGEYYAKDIFSVRFKTIEELSACVESILAYKKEAFAKAKNENILNDIIGLPCDTINGDPAFDFTYEDFARELEGELITSFEGVGDTSTQSKHLTWDSISGTEKELLENLDNKDSLVYIYKSAYNPKIRLFSTKDNKYDTSMEGGTRTLYALSYTKNGVYHYQESDCLGMLYGLAKGTK